MKGFALKSGLKVHHNKYPAVLYFACNRKLNILIAYKSVTY